MASGIRIGGAAPGSVAGAAEFQAFLRGYPQKVISDTRQLLDEGADELVEAIQERAPVSELEAHPGDLKASVHKVDGRHDLSVLVVEDAKDAKGEAYPAHVEYGHRTKDGGHVAPIPHFWPAVRANRGALTRAIARAFRRRAQDVG